MTVLILTGARTAAGQSSGVLAVEERGFVFNETFEGSANADGEVMMLTSSARYVFNRHFSVAIGMPFYFDRLSSSTTGTTSNSGVGNFFAAVSGKWKNPTLGYATSLMGSAPTGDSKKGLSTGHGTFDWNNRFDHEFGIFTPFADAGVANALTDTRFFLRPFTSYGDLAHFEAGTDLDLSHSFSLTVSAYDIAPWGNQTIFSRVVSAGKTGSGGSHGRVFETNHETTGGASLDRDNGFTAGVTASPLPYLDCELGYTRSVRFALNTVSFGVGLNLSKLFRERSGISK